MTRPTISICSFPECPQEAISTDCTVCMEHAQATIEAALGVKR